MKYKLQDLIDMEHFQNLQDRLNEIYSFPSSIIDNDGNILTATAWQDICTQFHRKNKDCEKLCIKSDQYIKDHIHEANPAVSYQCPHGLVDNATPIIIDGIHYGNFFTGQFFLEEPSIKFFRTQAQKYGFDEDAYLEAVKRVPIWTQKQLDNYLFFIKGLISVISESGLKKLKEIENRKLIEASEKRHRSILKSAMDGYWLTDTEGRLIEVNDAYCYMSGYSEDELLKMRIPDLEAVENSKLVAKHMQKVVLHGSDRFESEHRRKDGTVFNVEVSVQYRTEEGGQCVCFLRDITERKKAEDAVIIANKKMRLAADSAQFGIWDLDLKKNLLEWDDWMFRLYGVDRDDFGGAYEAWQAGVHPDDLDRSSEEVERALRGEKDFDTEFRIVRPDGVVRHLKAHATVSRNSQGEPIHMTGINYDITKQKVLEASIQRAQKIESIGNLAGGIAHDFNNILFPIIGMSEMLIEDLPPDSGEKKNAEEIFKAGQRGSDLVKQILAFSRQSEHKMMPTRIQNVLKEVIKLSRSTIPTFIEMKQDIQQDCGMVLADPSQIHQIGMNLITNAYHAVEDTGGIISIKLRQTEIEPPESLIINLSPGTYEILSISDTGHGMSEEIIGKIFDPYFSTKEQGKGTGLGLAVVYGIVKEHGGNIKVYSEIGKGSTFDIYLPSKKKTNSTESISSAESYQGGIERILLVDDEESVVNLEKLMLERIGYKVTSRLHSKEALAAFKASPFSFDLVVTDMSMPSISGDILAQKIKSIRSDVPIIICTGFSERIREENIRKIGIDGLLMKPIVRADLAKTVRKVLDEAKSKNQG